MDYIKLKLEEREWTSKTTGNSGKTYCLNNQANSSGTLAGHSYSLSILTPGDKAKTEPKIFAWFNDMSDDMYNAFCEEYTDTCYIHVPTKKILTSTEYADLGIDSEQEREAEQFAQATAPQIS